MNRLVLYLTAALDSHDSLRGAGLDVNLQRVPHAVPIVLPALLVLIIGKFITVTVNLTVK
jgi:hypothetical protein